MPSPTPELSPNPPETLPNIGSYHHLHDLNRMPSPRFFLSFGYGSYGIHRVRVAAVAVVGIKFSTRNRITVLSIACARSSEWHIFASASLQGPGNLRRALPADGDPGLRVPQAVAVVPRQPLRLLHGRIVRPPPHLPVREREKTLKD